MPDITYWLAQHGDEQVTMLASGDDRVDHPAFFAYVRNLGWPHSDDLVIRKMRSTTAYGSTPGPDGKDTFRYHCPAKRR